MFTPTSIAVMTCTEVAHIQYLDWLKAAWKSLVVFAAASLAFAIVLTMIG